MTRLTNNDCPTNLFDEVLDALKVIAKYVMLACHKISVTASTIISMSIRPVGSGATHLNVTQFLFLSYEDCVFSNTSL